MNATRMTQVLEKFSLIVLVISLGTMSGCATSKKFQDYPRRALDRPYTLLEGMSDVQVTFAAGYTKSSTFYDFSQPIPLGIFWTHAVSDRFSFLWFVLPLGFRYQAVRTSNHTFGFQFYYHIGDPTRPSVSPYLTGTDRIRIAENVEFQSDVGLQSHMLFKQNQVAWTFSAVSGPRFQLHDYHSTHLWLGVLREITPVANDSSLYTGVNYLWSVSQEFELEFRGMVKLAGNRLIPVSNTLGSVGLRYIW